MIPNKFVLLLIEIDNSLPARTTSVKIIFRWTQICNLNLCLSLKNHNSFIWNR
jgi:hypothetical protein